MQLNEEIIAELEAGGLLDTKLIEQNSSNAIIVRWGGIDYILVQCPDTQSEDTLDPFRCPLDLVDIVEAEDLENTDYSWAYIVRFPMVPRSNKQAEWHCVRAEDLELISAPKQVEDVIAKMDK